MLCGAAQASAASNVAIAKILIEATADVARMRAPGCCRCYWNC
jgi:hypothetical protein